MATTSLHYVRRTPLTDAVTFIRHNFAWLLAAGIFVLMAVFSKHWAEVFVNEKWDVGTFYAAIFDWSSIQSAFLFGIYAFILSGTEGFIKAVENTEAFQHAREFVRTTVYIALALTACCLPFLLIAPSVPIDSDSLALGNVVFAAVLSASIYVFCRFLTVVKLFGILERSRKR